jgi:hypothetical protein
MTPLKKIKKTIKVGKALKPSKTSKYNGRKSGTKKYQRETLLAVVKTIKPTSSLEWKEVIDIFIITLL